ncbi:MAG: hypothetical protein HZA51_07475 [Planctomycetes bacterium]|nr:hypothetical protein [Planctomycetota bacterium]
MAIQFLCSSCRQPIEVDDDAANQPVTCPYCRQVTQVPAASDPTVAAARASAPPPPPPTTAPSLTIGSESVGYGPAPIPIPQLEQGNKLSWASFVCAIISVFCFIGIIGYVASVAATLPPNPTPEQMNALVRERTAGPATQAIAILGSCVLPVIGVGLGIAALVKRTKPLWPAIVAMVIFSGFVLLTCASFALAVSSAATKKP